MIRRQEDATWIPPLNDLGLGWLHLNGETWDIVDVHHFDDFGVTLDTLRIERGDRKSEIYSFDECETFTFDCE